MKKRTLMALVGVIWAIGAAAPPQLQQGPLDAVLRDVVIEGRVDYAKIKTTHQPVLNTYLAEYQDVGAPEQPLAYYLNLYNVVMLKAVLEKRAANPSWKPSDENYGVFKEQRVKLKEGMKSLDYLENEIIRKQYKDPRIHAALNCAALSCPPLLNEAYEPDRLDQQLEQNFKRFVNDPTRNQFDDARKVMKLSSIFQWFAADFGGPSAVPGYIAKYRPGNYSGWKVEYLPYDWNLNEKK